MVVELYSWEPLTVCHHASYFGGFGHCGSADKMFLICEVISKEHVSKELYDSLGGSDFMGDNKSPAFHV